MDKSRQHQKRGRNAKEHNERNNSDSQRERGRHRQETLTATQARSLWWVSANGPKKKVFYS
jgi:hypothetical protein